MGLREREKRVNERGREMKSVCVRKREEEWKKSEKMRRNDERDLEETLWYDVMR